jgi:glycerophosphoryl diester phosphodiesterase
LVEKAHLQNLSVFIWGCHDIKAAMKVLQLDIDGLISDFPDQVKAVLD